MPTKLTHFGLLSKSIHIFLQLGPAGFSIGMMKTLFQNLVLEPLVFKLKKISSGYISFQS